MKKKISMTFAALGICASLSTFNVIQAQSGWDCIEIAATICPPEWGRCCLDGGTSCVHLKCFPSIQLT